jgi:hypothetical protein
LFDLEQQHDRDLCALSLTLSVLVRINAEKRSVSSTVSVGKRVALSGTDKPERDSQHRGSKRIQMV